MSLQINSDVSPLIDWSDRNSNRTRLPRTLFDNFRINSQTGNFKINPDIEKASNGFSTLRNAEIGLGRIKNLLVSMRELANDSANKSAGNEGQLAGVKSEISKVLDAVKSSGSSPDPRPLGFVGPSAIEYDPWATFDNNSLGISKPTDVDGLDEGHHDIDIIQASDGAVITSSAIQITDAWNNGLRISNSAAVARVIGTFAASTNVVGATGTVTLAVDYQESPEGPIGVQYLTFNVTAMTVNMSATMSARVVSDGLNNAIANNANLAGKVTAATANTGGIHIKSTGVGARYSVKVIDMETTGDITFNWSGNGTRTIVGEDDRGISLNDTLQVSAQLATVESKTVTWNNTAFSINNGTATTINTSSQLLTIMNKSLKVAFGTVHNGTGASAPAKVMAATINVGGQTGLKIYTLDEGSYFYLGFNDTNGEGGTGEMFGLDDNITSYGTDALVSLDGYVNTIREVRYWDYEEYLKTATLYDAVGPDRGSVSVLIGRGMDFGGINLGHINLMVNSFNSPQDLHP
ncbi:MAG: hypothetical protein GY855_08590 [candidate division Zixibacteria bacterium]|nr:hypothetical protein [candidate division Zixibacteria bacterium]